jgi:hypothetical protein
VGLLLVIGKEKRHRLVRRQLLRQHIRPLNRQRKGLLVLRRLILDLLVLNLRLVSKLLAQLLVSSLIGFIQPRITDGFVEPIKRISCLNRLGVLHHGLMLPTTDATTGVPCTYFLLLLSYRSPSTDG